mgnify:CR=1 FL=1
MDIINTYVIPHLIYPGLKKSLLTLHKNTPKNFRVILVDQSRNDNSELLKEGLVDVIVKCSRNLGFAKATNIGLRMADTEYVTALNDDVEMIYDRWWEDLMTVFRDREDAGAVNPHSPRNPQGGGGICDQYIYRDVLKDGNYTDEQMNEMKQVFSRGSKPGQEQIYPAGCTYCTVFRRSALLDVGKQENSPYGIALYDEAFGTGGGEDYDLVRRMGLKGYRFYGTHRSFVYHWWLSTRSMLQEAGYGESAYASTAKGYNTFRGKWGPTHGKGPNDTLDGADVYGRSGPKEPLDGQPWFSVVPL